MNYLKSKEDVRRAYEFIGFLSSTGRDFSTEIASIKRAIRTYYKEEDEKNKKYGKIVKDYGIDGFVALVALPEMIADENDANDYFYDHRRIGYRDQGYDCTGQMFTGWYIIVKRHGHFYAYHRVSVDC